MLFPDISIIVSPSPLILTAATPAEDTLIFTPESLTFAVQSWAVVITTLLLLEVPVMDGAPSGTGSPVPTVTVCPSDVQFMVISPFEIA